MTKGLPRSGKSTWAKDYVLRSGNAVRVNKDDLRAMLHAGKWSQQNERLTRHAEKAMVIAMLNKGKSVVVDNTHMPEKYEVEWKAVAEECGATFAIERFDEADLRVLAKRDYNSDSRRGINIITDTALVFDKIHFEDDSLIICDIDGTIANCEHRRKYASGDTKNWDTFFKLAPQDTLIANTDLMLKEYMAQGKHIMFVSARPEHCRQDTESWLSDNGWLNKFSKSAELANESKVQHHCYFGLLMRSDGDSRDDTVVKQQILDRMLKKEWIHTVIDDRPKIVRMWQDNGVPVIDVGNGIEF